jgi:thiol-disulfide isomerase/thioredoxin
VRNPHGASGKAGATVALRVICPQCKTKLKFEKDVSRRTCECPKCKTRFRPDETRDHSPAPEPRSAVEPSQKVPQAAPASSATGALAKSASLPRTEEAVEVPTRSARARRHDEPPEMLRRQRFTRSHSDGESGPQWEFPEWTVYAVAATLIGLILCLLVWLLTAPSSKPQVQVNRMETAVAGQSPEAVVQPPSAVPEKRAPQPASVTPQSPPPVVKKDVSHAPAKLPLKIGPWRVLSARLRARGGGSSTQNSKQSLPANASTVNATAAQIGQKGDCTVGSMAPEIEGRDLGGARLRLSDYRGKVVMLEFWAGWCPYCRKLFPYERDLVKKMRGRPFALLGVNVDKKADAAAIQRKRVTTWRSFQDGPNGPIGARWGVTGYPHIFILDHKGTIRFSGYRADAGRYTRVIEDLLGADDLKNASVSETHPFR